MKKVFLSMLVAGVSLWLASTVFSQSVLQGPILIVVAFVSLIYSLVSLHRHSQVGKLVVQSLLELLQFPWS